MVIETATGISLIFSLIPLFQREQDKKSSAKKENFFIWLINHKFDDLKEWIESNKEVNNELDKLLQINHEELLERFEEVNSKLYEILSKIDEFKNLASIADTPTTKLSDQAKSVLKQFYDSDAQFLVTMLTRAGTHIQVDNSAISITEPKFIDSDLDDLEEVGHITYDGNPGGSGRRFRITRQGVEFVENDSN